MLTAGVAIPAPMGMLRGDLGVVQDSQGLVIFVHGSGSGLTSWRNRAVAEHLQAQGLSTLLMDLLTSQEKAKESQGAAQRFDISLLAGRVEAAIDWVARQHDLASKGVGLFGSSTGAAAALVAAAQRPAKVDAVVCRGGRPDLAEKWLAQVQAPVELIVGSLDWVVLQFNRQALGLLGGPHQLKMVPGASHLFEEPGALDEVARLAAAWFQSWLRLRAQPSASSEGLGLAGGA